jgi:hypothetical protein
MTRGGQRQKGALFFRIAKCRLWPLASFAALEQVPGTVLLRASRKRETLVCDGMSAWDSISEARNIEFVR